MISNTAMRNAVADIVVRLETLLNHTTAVHCPAYNELNSISDQLIKCHMILTDAKVVVK